MAREVPLYMPKMSMTMETGELLSWAKGEGDTLRSGDARTQPGGDQSGAQRDRLDGAAAAWAQPGAAGVSARQLRLGGGSQSSRRAAG